MRSLNSWPAALVLLSLAAGTAAADPIRWSYAANVLILSDNAPPHIIDSLPDSGAVGRIELPGMPATPVADSANIRLTQLITQTFNNDGAVFGLGKSNFQLALALTDSASRASGSVSWFGTIGGGWDRYPTRVPSDVRVTFPEFDLVPRVLHLGGNVYRATIRPTVVPGAPWENVPGSLNAHVDVQPDVRGTPEPSTLVLGGLGLFSLAVAGRWRRRRQAMGVPV
jgi:MYXO-CTERM domain-containing protein